MIWLLTLLTALAQVQAQTPAADVSTLKVGSPAAIAELDLGKLKGDLRQIGWMADATKLYVQTAELQRGGPDNLHHYLVEANGGAVTSLEDQPQWAADYWAFKSDRSAPGIPSLMIDVDSRVEKIKIGPGSAGAADRTSNGLGGDNVSSAANVEKAAENQKQNVVRLVLLGETIGEFVNTRPIPGLTFSWGPQGSGAIAFVDVDGRLTLLDRQKHKQVVSGAKDALLPAWTADGQKLAYVKKTGRKKYALVCSDVSR